MSDYQTGWAHALVAVRKMLVSNGQPGLVSELLNLTLPMPFPPSHSEDETERLRKAGASLVRWFDGDGRVYSPPLNERIEAMRAALSPAPSAAPNSVGSAAWDRVERVWRRAFQYGVEACARRVECTACSAGLKPVMLGTALDLRSTFDILGEDGLPMITHSISPPEPAPSAAPATGGERIWLCTYCDAPIPLNQVNYHCATVHGGGGLAPKEGK